MEAFPEHVTLKNWTLEGLGERIILKTSKLLLNRSLQL